MFELVLLKDLIRVDPSNFGQDRLDALTEVAGVLQPDVSIVAKNAAQASYYTRCTASKVRRDADLVLLEVANNLWGADVGKIILAVRRIAPRALVLFVVWTTCADPGIAP